MGSVRSDAAARTVRRAALFAAARRETRAPVRRTLAAMEWEAMAEDIVMLFGEPSTDVCDNELGARVVARYRASAASADGPRKAR